jgi:hypothetical protein
MCVALISSMNLIIYSSNIKLAGTLEQSGVIIRTSF